MSNIYERSVKAFDEALKNTFEQSFSPSPKLSFLEWSRKNIKLSKQSSERAGDFEPFPYQVEIMEEMGNPRAQTVIVVKPTQVGYTLTLEAKMGYNLDGDPCSTLFYLPKDDDLRRFHDDHFLPMVNNVEAVQQILRHDGEWNIRRTTKGSKITFLSAAVAANFQSHRAREVMIDEISSDAYNPSGKIKEDKVNAAFERTGSFHNRKHLVGGTPSVLGQCRVWSWFLRGDQRRLFVPDPKTGEFVLLEKGDRSSAHGLKWDGRDDSSVRFCFPPALR